MTFANEILPMNAVEVVSLDNQDVENNFQKLKGEEKWTILDKIRFVLFYRVRWSTTLLATAFFVIVYCLQHYKVWPPSLNMPVDPSNPLIQYPLRPDIVPIWAVYIIFAVFPIIFLCGEFLFYSPASALWEQALGASRGAIVGRRTTIWSLAMIETFSWTSLFCFILKQIVGELRPNYLAALSPTNLLGGRESFPSGHSSFVFSTCTLYSFYFYWSFFVRSSPFTNSTTTTKMQNSAITALKNEVKLASMTIFPFSFFALAGWISVTRVMDFHHYIWDITYGMMLGVFFAFLILVRTVLVYFPSSK